MDAKFLSKQKSEGEKKSLRLLFRAVKDGNAQLTEALLKKGIDVNTKDSNDRTPLMHAVMFDNIEIVKLLVRYGADVNAKDKYGRSVLQLAEEGSGTLIEFLKEHGAEE